MRRPERTSWRTFRNVAFIRSAMLSRRIFLTLLSLPLFELGVRNLYLRCPLRCPVIFIQEFYSNIHSIDISVPWFATAFWDTRIVVTPDLISKVLHVLRVGHPNYPRFKHLQIVSKDELLSYFCETPSIWGGKQNTPCSGFAKGLRFLNMVIYSYFIVLL